jgi:hypothetical protein
LREFSQIAPSFDEFGRQNLLRDRVAARIGYANADRYVQKPSAESRPLMDEKFANLENSTLLGGAPLSVYPNDNHTVHSRVHLDALSQAVAGIQEGSSDMVQVLPGLVSLMEHTTQHVEAMSADPTVKEESAANRKMLSQLNEIVTNGAKHVEKLRREAGGTPEGAAMQGSADQDLKIQHRIEENQLKLQFMREQADLKMQLREKESLQKRALKDAETAQKLASRV